MSIFHFLPYEFVYLESTWITEISSQFFQLHFLKSSHLNCFLQKTVLQDHSVLSRSIRRKWWKLLLGFTSDGNRKLLQACKHWRPQCGRCISWLFSTQLARQRSDLSAFNVTEECPIINFLFKGLPFSNIFFLGISEKDM